MLKLTRRGAGWLLEGVPVRDGARAWIRGAGKPWRNVTLRIVDGALLVEEDPPPMRQLDINEPLPIVRPEDFPPEPYPPPEDAQWSWELPDDAPSGDAYYPGAPPNVVAVGSVDGAPSAFSRRGYHVDLAAPGERVIVACSRCGATLRACSRCGQAFCDRCIPGAVVCEGCGR